MIRILQLFFVYLSDVAKGAERISPQRKKYWRRTGYFADNFKGKPNLSKMIFQISKLRKKEI